MRLQVSKREWGCSAPVHRAQVTGRILSFGARTSPSPSFVFDNIEQLGAGGVHVLEDDRVLEFQDGPCSDDRKRSQSFTKARWGNHGDIGPPGEEGGHAIRRLDSQPAPGQNLMSGYPREDTADEDVMQGLVFLGAESTKRCVLQTSAC